MSWFCFYVRLNEEEELSRTEVGIFRHPIGKPERHQRLGLAEARLIAGESEELHGQLDAYELALKKHKR